MISKVRGKTWKEGNTPKRTGWQGWLFIYEEHPVLYMFEPSEHDDPPRLYYSYFRDEPDIDEDGLDYYGMTTYKSLPLYSFPHKLSDIISACLDNGLTPKSFSEYGHDITNLWAHFERFRIKPPLCYTLVAQADAEVRLSRALL